MQKNRKDLLALFWGNKYTIIGQQSGKYVFQIVFKDYI